MEPRRQSSCFLKGLQIQDDLNRRTQMVASRIGQTGEDIGKARHSNKKYKISSLLRLIA